MRLRDKASRILSSVRKIARDWTRELKERGISPFFGWLLTGAFAFYLFAIFTAHSFLEHLEIGIKPPVLLVPLWICAAAVAIAGVCLWSKRFGKRLMSAPDSTIPSWQVGVGVFLVYFAWLVFMWVNPEAKGSDTWDQLQQAYNFRFNDWHPILHTFSLYLITRIHDSLFAIATVQVIAFSALAAWLYWTLRRMASGRVTLLVTLFVALNPVNFIMLRIVRKDVDFALVALGVSIAVLNIVASRGEWLKRNVNVVLLALLLFLTTFYRHNGIFFTAPLCLGLAFARMSRSARIRLFAAFVVLATLAACYQGAKHASCLTSRGVIQTGEIVKGQRFAESIGLLMCGITEAYVNSYEQTPDEAKALMSKFGERSQIKDVYRGDYNSVKFNAKDDPTLIIVRNTTPKELLEIFLMTARAAPHAVMKSILHVTSLVWDPLRTDPPLPRLSFLKRELLCPISIVLSTPVGCVFASVGFWMLVLVGVATVGFVYRRRTAWLVSVPWLCYGFGTMCFLSHNDWRFFYALVLCAPLAVAVLFMRRQNDERTDEAANVTAAGDTPMGYRGG